MAAPIFPFLILGALLLRPKKKKKAKEEEPSVRADPLVAVQKSGREARMAKIGRVK